MLKNKKYAIVASKVWDGTSDNVQHGMAVIVNGQKIEAICPENQLPDTIEMCRFDKGSTLLPGLIDAHVHYSPWMAPAFLAAGVTTVRDVGNDLDWIIKQRTHNQNNIISGPDIVCCGTMLDGPDPYWHHIGRGHSDTKALRESIRQHAEQGIRYIKFYDGMDLEFIKEGVKEAKQHGLWILADFGTDEPKAADAVRAGINEIQHLSGCPAAWHTSDKNQQDELIDILLTHQVIMTPTMLNCDHLGRVLETVFQFDSRRKWVHPAYLDFWQQTPLRDQQHRELRAKFQKAAPNQKSFLKRLFERKITLGFGTDTPFQFIIPGFSVHDELAMYVDAGIPTLDALRSSTSINAALLGLEKSIGQIKPGFQADMIVVSSNPFENIQDISDIECVVRRGLILPHQELNQLSIAQCNQTLDDPLTRDMLRYLKSKK